MDEYPSLEDIAFLKGYDIISQPIEAFLEKIQAMWWGGEQYCPVVKCKDDDGKDIIKVELHTVGWSGNEEIIGVLREHFFWTFFWQKSERGGHYYFTVDKLI